MITPICSKCQFLTDTPVRLRPCAKIPIFHRDMLCTSPDNTIKDNVTGVEYTPFCEEVNRHGECLAYKPVDLEKPEINFFEEDNLVVLYGKSQFVVTADGTNPTSKLEPVGVYDEELELYKYDFVIEHTSDIKAACIIDGVLSEIEELRCEVPDVPVIEFDKSTNTVTILSFNKVYFTVDGSKVTEDSDVYEGPFVIEHNTTVKAKSYARDDFSIEVSRYCISIEPPVIEFDQDTNKVTILADDTILYSVDGSDIYDDSDVYDEPVDLTQNTIVKAACIVDGELSEQVEKECKVANTLDGSDVKKSSTEYDGPFAITETCTVKASSFADEKESETTELECVFVSPPEITFDPESNTVTITGENTILYSTDGSHIYDDSDEYQDPFTIDKNTTVRAACILDGILSDEVTLECKVPSIPVITYAANTKTVTIKSDNPVLYTTDGSDVKKKDAEYKGPFKIIQTTTVKAKSIVDGKLSDQAEMECVVG